MEKNPDQRHSRFLKQTMLQGERVVRRGEFHWTYSLGAWMQALIWVGLGFGIAAAMAKFGGGKDAALTAPENRVVFLAPLLGILIGGFAFLKKMIVKWTTEIVLTDKRFLYKSGVFSIIAYKLNMREINYCNITQSLVGNMMNYGQIYMFTHTLDDKNIYLPPIADPHGFSTEIENLKKTAY
ncbi:MAG TPA: PH domain-containing protein [Patescibacteria group bacterium]|nr:PH domain-containing protein [Patescibacteria group bacterium]